METETEREEMETKDEGQEAGTGGETLQPEEAPSGDVTTGGDEELKSESGDEAGNEDPELESSKEAGKDKAGEPGNDDSLRISLLIRNGRTVIGAKGENTDVYFETVAASSPAEALTLAAEVVERARRRWEQTPTNPAYKKPGAPAKRNQTRRANQAAANTAPPNAAAGTNEAEGANGQPQQTLRLL